jgi:hypothetical protein
MGMFGKRISEAKPSQGGVYWLPGQYLVQLDMVKTITSRKGEDCFIVEGDNLESTNEERPAGSHCSQVIPMSQDSAPGNIKLFLAAALNVQEHEVTEEGAEACVTSDNPLHGRLVRLEVVNIKTRAGNDFSKHNWRPVTDEFQAKADELRAAAGMPPF